MDPTQLGAYQVESLIQQSDQRTHLIWKTILRGLATICAVVGIILQARVVKASGGYNYEYDYYYSSYDYWFSPESFAFVSVSHSVAAAQVPKQQAKSPISARTLTALELRRVYYTMYQQARHPPRRTRWTRPNHLGWPLECRDYSADYQLLLLLNYRSRCRQALLLVRIPLTSMHPLAFNLTPLHFPLTRQPLSVLHFVLFVWACVDTHRRRRIRRAELVAQVTSAMQQQQLAQGRISTLGGLSTGAQNIPPGMALVPVEQLAQLRSLQATYQSDPVSPRPPIPQAYGQAQPYALVPHNEPVSPVAGTRGSVQHTINPLTGTPPVVAAPSSQSPTSENIAELRTAPGNY